MVNVFNPWPQPKQIALLFLQQTWKMGRVRHASFKSELGKLDNLLQACDLMKNKKRIQKLATRQLLNVWSKAKDRDSDPLFWGDEIECLTIRLDEDSRQVRLIPPPWMDLSRPNKDGNNPPEEYQTELGYFMIETMPKQPLGKKFSDLLRWEQDFRERRRRINDALKAAGGGSLLSLPYFPRFGAHDGAERHGTQPGRQSESSTLSNLIGDENMTRNSRYHSVMKAIVDKRGKVDVHVPVFRDKHTPWPWYESSNKLMDALPDVRDVRPNFIYMDSPIFGATGCSLQVTMQAKNEKECRRLHDQFIPLAPIMLALTAGSPIFRGYLAAIDSRWPLFEQSVDDRNSYERATGVPSRSRVSTSTNYIADDSALKQTYQIPELERDADVWRELRKYGLDDQMASHFAHIFSRDPLFAPSKELEEADESKTLFLDSLLSNVYQLVRFKPPSSEKMGWRVEFRPMEAQLNDFENAAFGVFIILVAKTIMETKPNFYVALLQVEENLRKACNAGAAISEKFYFRSNPVEQSTISVGRLTADEVINEPKSGEKGRFDGLIPLINQYLDKSSIFNDPEREQIDRYLQLVSERASGTSPTTAAWIRRFIQQHPDYKQDSVVSEKVSFDLIKSCLSRSNNSYSL